MKIPAVAAYLALSLAASAACSGKTATPATAVVDSGTSATTALQPAASHAVATSPTSAEGIVVETMDAASYTYVRVKSASGEIWAATSTFTVAVGDRVVVPLENPMENFHSQTLKRDFPVIYFASKISRGGAAGATNGASA